MAWYFQWQSNSSHGFVHGIVWKCCVALVWIQLGEGPVVADKECIMDLPRASLFNYAQRSYSYADKWSFVTVYAAAALVGTNIEDIQVWKLGSKERLVVNNFKIWDPGVASLIHERDGKLSTVNDITGAFRKAHGIGLGAMLAHIETIGKLLYFSHGDTLSTHELRVPKSDVLLSCAWGMDNINAGYSNTNFINITAILFTKPAGPAILSMKGVVIFPEIYATASEVLLDIGLGYSMFSGKTATDVFIRLGFAKDTRSELPEKAKMTCNEKDATEMPHVGISINLLLPIFTSPNSDSRQGAFSWLSFEANNEEFNSSQVIDLQSSVRETESPNTVSPYLVVSSFGRNMYLHRKQEVKREIGG